MDGPQVLLVRDGHRRRHRARRQLPDHLPRRARHDHRPARHRSVAQGAALSSLCANSAVRCSFTATQPPEKILGTIGAALEADVYGIPAMAAAITAQTSEWHTFGELDWSAARHFTGLGRTASGRG